MNLLNPVVLTAGLILAGTFNASACDLTVPAGGNVQVALNTVGKNEICLAPGVYSLATSLYVPNSKSLIGNGASRDDVRIVSSADVIVELGSNTMIKNLRLEPASGHSPTYGVMSYHKNEVIIWGLRVLGSLINIGINGSSNVHVWDTMMAQNGRANGIADPNMWVSNATNVDIQWGAADGRNNGPGGDGEISVGTSTSVKIYGTYVTNSGASAIYLVNCDSCSVENATITGANEWGLDIVDGSDNFVAKGNRISKSKWGGSVFNGSGYATNNIAGQYINNVFTNNNTSGYSRYCNGINYGGPASFTATGSTGGGVLVCKPW